MDLNKRVCRTRPAGGADSGFTLVELAVGMIIMTMLAALSVSGWTSYQRTTEHRQAAEALVSTMRNAQQRSVAEAATYCVSFDVTAKSYRLFKFSCGAGGTPIGGARKTGASRILLGTTAFQQPDGTTSTTALFYPRGSATKGTVQLGRSGASKTYTITVEGLTGRVSLKG